MVLNIEGAKVAAERCKDFRYLEGKLNKSLPRKRTSKPGINKLRVLSR